MHPSISAVFIDAEISPCTFLIVFGDRPLAIIDFVQYAIIR